MEIVSYVIWGASGLLLVALIISGFCEVLGIGYGETGNQPPPLPKRPIL